MAILGLIMAHNDTEIEKKFELSEASFRQIKDRLAKFAEFRKSSHQVDEYFTPHHRDFLDYDFPFEWLRIGLRDTKTILNYKHFYPENSTPFSHCDEFETEISDPERLKKIFAAIDMRPLITVDKQREVFIVDDELEVVLDNVKGLGYFMEIETLKDFGSIEAGTQAIFDMARRLGLDVGKTVERGYPYLVMDKLGILRK
ncbi:class IV adenylate cyclase [Candidatus Woesearchaeota archaeon]|nr:class IV adenylate cyclase [Candidatus Woesearchaeota archaeon]